MAITLTSGMRQNLFALQQIDRLMNETQTRLATGKRVNSALDDPINFFRSKGHMDRANVLSALKDGMSEAIKVIEAADSGIEAINDLLAQMVSIANAAKTSSNTADLAIQYNDIKTQINNLASDSGYGGKNLLDSDTLSVEFNEDGTNTLSVVGFDATSSVAGVAISNADFTDNTTIEAGISEIKDAISALETEAQKLSSNLSMITIRGAFTDKMIATLETGAEQLVLADMNEEGANMLMLQTRQALGMTALTMSSEAAQSVLRLF
jgi:flagellin